MGNRCLDLSACSIAPQPSTLAENTVHDEVESAVLALMLGSRKREYQTRHPIQDLNLRSPEYEVSLTLLCVIPAAMRSAVLGIPYNGTGTGA
jgi:hypothetical protein